jgi:hypothetical protein
VPAQCRYDVPRRMPVLSTALLLPSCFHGGEFVEATLRINRAKSPKFNGLLARPKRFELLTPRFVVCYSQNLNHSATKLSFMGLLVGRTVRKPK